MSIPLQSFTFLRSFLPRQRQLVRIITFSNDLPARGFCIDAGFTEKINPLWILFLAQSFLEKWMDLFRQFPTIFAKEGVAFVQDQLGKTAQWPALQNWLLFGGRIDVVRFAQLVDFASFLGGRLSAPSLELAVSGEQQFYLCVIVCS